MELAIFIKEFLYNNDTLVIPGFGGFRTNYKGAEINKAEHSISPPTKYLVFDLELNTSDDTFIKFVAEQKKVTKKAAEKFVKHQIDLLSKKLEGGETILLEGIGYLSKDNGVIRFDREHDSNFLTESYGFSKIDYKPVEVSLEPQPIPTYMSNNQRNYNKLYIVLGTLIVLAGAAFILYIYYPDIKDRFFKTKPNIKVAVTPADSTKDTSTVAKSADTTKSGELEKFFDSKTNKKKALAIDSAREIKPSKGTSYFIIAGSFKTFKRATILSGKLKKDGFKPEVLQFGENLYRVSLGEFGNKALAITEYERIRTLKGNEAVWLLAK